MKNRYNYICLLLGVLFFASCDFSDDVKDVQTSAGSADFTTYVALGNSLTSGYQDAALYRSGQENSYPAMIAQGMNLAYEFNQPLMNDDLGGIPSAGIKNKLVLSLTANGLTPVPGKGEGTTTLANIYKGQPFHNLGVPGAKVAHLLAPGYGNPAGLMSSPMTANPYYVRFASSPNSSVIADALAAKPTFFTLWIGNNDLLGYATSGGDGSNPLTPAAAFAKYYTMLIQQLTANGAKGAIANIPGVASIPFFNTIPNDALKLDQEQAQKLTVFFGMIAKGLTQQLMAKGLPQEKAAAIANQYAIKFNEGNNLFLIETEKTAMNPLAFRQMTKEELLVLTIDRTAMATKGYGSVNFSKELMAVVGKLQKGGTPTPEDIKIVISAINPIKDKDVLDVKELAEIKSHTEAYNATIAGIAKEKGLALVDMNSLMKLLATKKGLRINGVTYNADFVKGGVFSLDGVHPTQRGYVLVANHFIKAINNQYDATIPTVNPNNYKGVDIP